jgi:uncharacterized protein YodC (DUF2158 family)
MPDFQIGDVVQLNSGGPLMTVTHVGPGNIDCVWFDIPQTSDPRKAQFDITSCKPKASSRIPGVGESEPTDSKEYKTFADFYDAASPATEEDGVLVAGFWFQVLQDQESLDSQTLNTELKNTGHPVAHMPHALDKLMKAKPRLIVQLRKQGKTRQAKRKFKLTTEGVKKVREMLARSGT